MSYVAPVPDMLFCMKELADLEAVARLPGFEDAGVETARAVLDECARFSQEVLAPLLLRSDVDQFQPSGVPIDGPPRVICVSLPRRYRVRFKVPTQKLGNERPPMEKTRIT